MATITDATIPGVGIGILMPKLTHRFGVEFVDGSGNHIADGEYLAAQVLSIVGISESKGRVNSIGNSTTGGDFSLIIEDDVNNKAMSVIRSLYDNNKKFTTIVSMLDGNNEVLSTERYYDCMIVQIFHSDRTYAPNGRKSITMKIPNWVGELIETLSDDPKAAAVVAMLNGSTLSMSESDDNSYSTIRKTLLINYGSVSHKL